MNGQNEERVGIPGAQTPSAAPPPAQGLPGAVYTAAQVAVALGVRRQTAQVHLDIIQPDATVMVAGNPAKAWSFARLPQRLQKRLAKAAKEWGCRNGEHLLSDPPTHNQARPGRCHAAAARPPEQDNRYFDLRLALSQVQDTEQLSQEQQRHVLVKGLETYDALVGLGESPKVVKSRVLKLLFLVIPAASHNALRVKFDRAYDRWIASERQSKVLADGRIAANEARAKPISQEDRDIIVSHTVIACGGRLSQGFRECLRNAWLSEELAGSVIHNPADKSYVPNRLRSQLTNEIRMLMSNHHGECETRDNGAYIERYWDVVPSLAWYCADDATLPIYFYVPDGNGWFTLMRGQFLIVIDARSNCVLGYALMPERNYNARVIRTLLTRVFDEYGLPQKGFYFERGIWKDSKILTGVQGDGLLD